MSNAQSSRISTSTYFIIFVLTCEINIDVTIEVEVKKSLPQKMEQLLLASRNMWYTLLEEYFETLTWKKREKKRRKEACVYVCMYVYIH